MTETNNLLTTVLICKTNIKFKKDLKTVAAVLNDEPGIECWSLDFDDVDRVLRIKSSTLTVARIVCLLNEIGFHCEELPD